MKHFKSTILFVALATLVSCVWPLGDGVIPTPVPIGGNTERPDEYYEQRRERDTDRDEVINRAITRDRGPRCEGDDDCEDLCDDIYNTRNDRDDCEELSVSQVERLSELHEFIEDPDFDDLQDIDFRDFDVYLNISIEPLEKEIRGYNSREAKDFLSWLVLDEKITKIFEKEDNEYAVFQKILEEAKGDGLENKLEKQLLALQENLEGRQTFLDIASNEANEVALDMVHDYMQDVQCEGDLETVSCLKKYCAIGDAMDEPDDLLKYRYFENYIEDIIDEQIGCNKPRVNDVNENTKCMGGSEEITWKTFYEEIDDIGEWNEDLCG